ncbi:hypothetical protein [Niveibacterium sp. SC-1]|uniref:hypothetical protein n=1 Tax=Niveibacterium sp. SC-1 TaxID=3135646 RepID=UPI00312032D6
MEEACYWFMCFAPPIKSDAPRIFGFAEFISALALLVITYTLVDVRYRFRLSIAPTPLHRRTFAVIGLIGVETLLTEVWLAQGWWLPKTVGLTLAIWQGFFGLLFLVTFMTWVWFAYIRPPIYSRRNYRRYAEELYRYVLKGSDSELATIADELRRSAKALVAFAPSTPRRGRPPEDATSEPRITGVEGYAYDVLRLIANRKLCRHIVASAPATAIVLFEEAVAAKKYNLPLGTFAKNITAEAVANLDSLLYHEADPFSSGLLGHLQPFRQAIYGHFALVEGLGDHFGSPLDVDYQECNEWSAHQWKAYNRAAITTLGAYVRDTGGWSHPYSLFRAVDAVDNSVRDLFKLQGIEADFYSTDICQRLDTAVQFVRDAVEEIDKQEHPPEVRRLRRREGDHNRDIYDLLAGLMFELVFKASTVSGPPDTAWTIHYGMVWGRFFSGGAEGRTWKTLQFKLRRLLYNEIATMEKLPNFKNARILGLCLNVVGLKVGVGSYGRSYRALAKVILPFAKRCYPRLREQSFRVAGAVLIGGITYDAEHNRLVKTYLQGLSDEPSREYLQLDAVEEKSAMP